ncbi:eCIS core domain-containing protein [Pseudonocardia xinjiangensis]|uniref:eCIS core domain-containing protein n=1 Tax=Pseudonocardia xinjiangensis TaxID=75289 RepID=UPI003D8C82A8
MRGSAPEIGSAQHPVRSPARRAEGSAPVAAEPDSGRLPALQRLAGNGAVNRMLADRPQPGHEEIVPPDGSGPGGPEPVHRSAVHDVLASPGRALDDRVRRDMETWLGTDFSGVRVHSDVAAQRSATEIGARAYTSGEHVVLGAGTDRRTIAHELTHVVQQRRGPVSGTDQGNGLHMSHPDDRFEQEADAVASAVVSGLPATGVDSEAVRDRERAAPGSVVQRMPARAMARPRRRPLPAVPEESADAVEALAPETPAQVDAGAEAAGRRRGADKGKGRADAPAEAAAATTSGSARDGGLPRPPERISEGQLGGGDRVLHIDGPDNAVSESLLRELAHVLNARQLDEAREQVAAPLSLQALQPVLSSLTRGDVMLVALDVGGWTGEIEVTARVVTAAARDTLEKLEFEDGGDRSTSVSELGERRSRIRFGGIVSAKPSAATGFTFQGGGLRDRITSNVEASVGRSFARTKTPERALRMDTEIQVAFDLSGLRGPRRLPLVGSRREIGQRGGDEGSGSGVTVPALVAGPAAEAAGAPGPDAHLMPPVRVQETRALGGMDVVQDVYAVDAAGKRTGGGVRALLGSETEWASLESCGRRVFTEAWPAVRRELLAHLTMVSLQSDLKAMMVGKGLEIPLMNGRGTIRVAAEIEQMRHVRTTAQTEFNIGTDASRTVGSSVASGRRAEGVFSGSNSDFNGAPLSGSLGVPLEYGRESRSGAQITVRSGTGIKMKARGAVFAGIAGLTFSVLDAASTTPTTAYSRVGFQAVVAADESVVSAEASRFAAVGERGAMRAPSFAAGATVRRPGEAIWGSGGQSGGGLPAHAVIIDVLAGSDDAHNPVADLAGALGQRQLGEAWPGLRPVVLGAFSRERLAASIPAMTRNVPLQSPPLIRARHGSAWMAATARLERLDYVRELSNNAELNVLNDVSEGSAAGRSSYRGGGVEGQGGVEHQFSEAVSGQLPGLGGEFAVRHRKGSEARRGGGSVASGKFSEPMVVFIGTATVNVRLSESGVAEALGDEPVPLRFVVAVPKSHTDEHQVVDGAGGAQSFRAPPTPAGPSGAGGAPTAAPRAAVGPERVSRTGQIGASDVVVRLDDDRAVVDKLRAEIGDGFGPHWREVEEKVLPLFDPVALRPLVSALTHGRSWGTSVTVDKTRADIRIVSATAAMTSHLRSVPAFEFEVGTDSTTAEGTSRGHRNRVAAIAQGSVSAPHVAVTVGERAYVDRMWERGRDHSAAAVSRGKSVEPAELFTGRLSFDIEVRLRGGPPRTMTAVMRGEFAFPARDMPARPGAGPGTASTTRFRPPSRIAQSQLLGASDIVLELLQPEQAPPVGAVATTSTAVPVPVPSGRLSSAAVLDQLADTGVRAFGSPKAWAAARAELAEKFTIDELRTRMRSMMAGQSWTITLKKHGSVVIRSSVEEMTHAANIPSVEFNSGAAAGLALQGTDGRPSADSRSAYVTSVGVEGTSDPSGVAPALVGGVTGAYERGVDATSDHRSGRSAGGGTKSKVPGSVFDGVAVLDFEFRPPRRLLGRTVDRSIGKNSGRFRQEMDRITTELQEIARSEDELRAANGAGGPNPVAAEEGLARRRAVLMAEQADLLEEQTAEIRRRPRTEPLRDPRIDAIDQRILEVERARRQFAFRSPSPTASAIVETNAASRLERLAAERARLLARSTSPDSTATPMTKRAFLVKERHTGRAKVRFRALVESSDALEVDQAEDARFRVGQPATPGLRRAWAARRAEPRTVRVAPEQTWRNGLPSNAVIRDLPDVGSLFGLLDTYGRQIYRGAWDSGPTRGLTNSERAKQAFSREQLMANLPRLTQGDELTSPRFRVKLGSAWVSVTAEVVELAEDREERGADVALVAENTTRFRERERKSKLGGLTGQFGAVASGVKGSPSGTGFLGFSLRKRQGTEVQSGGRVVSNSKVTLPLVHFDGHVRFLFTFHGGSGPEAAKAVSGIVPFAVSLPTEQTSEQAEPAVAAAVHSQWTHPTAAEPAVTDSIKRLEQDLRTAGDGSGFLVRTSRPRPEQVDQHRVVNRDGRILWYEARSNRLVHPPWDAMTVTASRLTARAVPSR